MSSAIDANIPVSLLQIFVAAKYTFAAENLCLAWGFNATVRFCSWTFVFELRFSCHTSLLQLNICVWGFDATVRLCSSKLCLSWGFNATVHLRSWKFAMHFAATERWSSLLSLQVPAGSSSRGGDVGVYVGHKPTELAHSFLFCSRVCFYLYGPFNCISFHKFSRQISASLFCSCGLISASSVLSAI